MGARCFRCFASKLTASDLSFAAEILGRRRFDVRNNSEPLTVLSLFSAVWAQRCKGRDSNATAGNRFNSALNEICITAMILRKP
jgi:hypothetical protein